MMHDLPEKRLTEREAAALERNGAEVAMRDWLRAQAADRRPDGIHGGPFWYLIRVRHGSEWMTGRPGCANGASGHGARAERL